jgi:copper chaperone CopZ
MCENHGALAAAGYDAASMPDARAYAVKGMTCEHCVAAVTQEVARVPGVAASTIDLEAGRLAVGGDGFGDDAIRAAVDEAGYQFVEAIEVVGA